MKGLTHFVAGLAAASFFPTAVEAGANGNPIFFILGGVFGLLPDTIDFKIRRFFSGCDMHVVPDPKRRDAQMIADGIAHAINEAHSTGVPVRIKLHTIPLGPDTWQRYTVRFDVSGRRIAVEYGPVVTTGQIPEPDQSKKTGARATASFGCELTLDYQAENVIDILDGPVFEMAPDGQGRIQPSFIPWHRTWTHSLLAACCSAVVVGASGSLLGGMSKGIAAGGAVLCAYLAHILLDQLGFMGSSLLFPASRKRVAGLGVMHATDALPNFVMVWTCCLLVFWNLSTAAPPHVPRLNLLQLITFGVLAPLGVLAFARRISARREYRP